MKITLVRHTSVAVPAGICYGQTDVEVADSFVSEAEVVASKLKNVPFDAVYTSPLQRCRKLAVFCGYAKAQPDERLMEMNFGLWEMQAWNAIDDPTLSTWFDNWQEQKAGGTESFNGLIQRIADFLKDLPDNQHILIFTHAGVIRAFGILLNQFQAEKAFDFQVAYGEVVEMDF